MVIEPIFEAMFLDVSHGFRPGRGALDALGEVDRLLEQGYTHVVDADLQAFFVSIPHLGLMARVRESISDGRLLKLLQMWLNQDIMAEGNRTLKGWYGYFKYAASNIFKKLDMFVRRRLRAMLLRQNKRHGFGRSPDIHKRWPNSFFADKGLFTMYQARLAAF